MTISDRIHGSKAQQGTDRIGTWLAWLANRPPHLWRIMALSLLALISVLALFYDSIVIDGTRYFWLDDDQMISMRYARNLAEGHGLVWNPGERVEGYSNFLWTLVMAAVHLLPVGDAKTSLLVRIVNLALAGAALLLSERLLRIFHPRPGLALPALLLTLALCIDLLFWSITGFETTLLTAVFLLVVVRLLEESKAGHPRLGTYLLLSLLPLIRSDAYYVWASAALLALGTSRNRWQTVRLLGISLFLPVLHLLFRRWYYGDWLPNTYYLKVYEVPGLFGIGVKYLLRFVEAYSVPLAVALLGTLLARDRHRWLLSAGLLIGAFYLLIVGGDMFLHSRFLAHYVPVLFVLALAGILDITQRGSIPQFLLLIIFSLSLFFQGQVYHYQNLRAGGQDRVIAGVLIERYTAPQAKIAVIAAGNTPYFSRRYAIDLLGKSDPHIARQPAYPGGVIGHNKFDPEYSLGLGPDLVVMFMTHNNVLVLQGRDWTRNARYETAIANAPTFQQAYLPNPVDVPGLLQGSTLYIRSSSAELQRIGAWKRLDVSK